LMSSGGQSAQKVVQTRAGIYAGKCGLDFLDFVSKLDQAPSPFSLFMGAFRGVAVDPAHCQTAQDLIETSFGTTGVQREALLGPRVGGNVNLFMAVLGMTKIGVQLRSAADVDGAGGNGNGTVDAGYDSCDPASLSDGALAGVGTGFALLLDNLTAITSSLSNGNATLLDGLSAACSDPSIATNPCTVTSASDPIWSDPTTLMIVRSLVKSQNLGIESCTSGNPPIPYPFNCCF
ncbi:MAG: hypothetical protein KF789_14955, partial [Bdellovibrionaceae bacterium]|nr:hypothetical protein [Pseudobdellovibrionaceae bacterium]